MDQLRRMIEETRNMLYGVFPHGCYAKLVGIPSPGAAPQAAASSASGSGLERSSERLALPNPSSPRLLSTFRHLQGCRWLPAR